MAKIRNLLLAFLKFVSKEVLKLLFFVKQRILNHDVAIRILAWSNIVKA